MRNKKLLYVLDFDASWHGGVNYFVNQIIGLMDYSSVVIMVVASAEVLEKIKSGIERDRSHKNKLADLNFIDYVVLEKTRKFEKLQHFLRVILNIKNPFHKKIIDKAKPSSIIHMGALSGSYSNVCQIAWIPDMQHIELSSNFSLVNQVKRSVGYFFLSLFSDKVMLSSDSQKNIFNSFYFNLFKSKSFVNKFRVRNVVDVYPLEKDYPFLVGKKIILFPSAFWLHKNHNIILKLIKRDVCSQCAFVFTGGARDYRNPEYSKSLQKTLYETMDSMSGRVYFFPSISNENLATLMKNAAILVNPSFYEGWSTIVEEAKLNKIPVLLSNISTHVEQFDEYGIGHLFDPDDVESLNRQFTKCIENGLNKFNDEFSYQSLIRSSAKILFSQLR